MPLADAVAVALRERGLTLASLSRTTKYYVTVVFSDGAGAYWSVIAGIMLQGMMTPD